MPTVMPSWTSATMSSIVTRLSGTAANSAPQNLRIGRQIVHSASVAEPSQTSDVALPDFHGSVVLVTGGCRGIGRGITQRFSDAGAHTAVCCRNEPESLPDGTLFVAADVRDAEQIDTVIDATVDRKSTRLNSSHLGISYA